MLFRRPAAEIPDPFIGLEGSSRNEFHMLEPQCCNSSVFFAWPMACRVVRRIFAHWGMLRRSVLLDMFSSLILAIQRGEGMNNIEPSSDQ